MELSLLDYAVFILYMGLVVVFVSALWWPRTDHNLGRTGVIIDSEYLTSMVNNKPLATVVIHSPGGHHQAMLDSAATYTQEGVDS